MIRAPLRPMVLLAAVLALCATLYGTGLGEIPFLGKDEPKNAQTAREMRERDDWVITTLAREPWYDKPILIYWCARVGYALFGVGEMGARLGPVVAALATVALTFLLGRRWLGPGGGSLAALALGTGLEFFWLARSAVPDTLLTLGVTGALVAYAFAREGIHPARNLRLAYAAAGVAVLAKGPVGLVLPALVVAADRILDRPREERPRLHLASGIPILAAVVLPWYILVTVRSGGQFVQEFLLHKNLERYLTEHLPHPGPIYYYLPVILLAPFPWSAFLPAAAVRLWRGRGALPEPQRRRVRLLLLWIALPFVFFSLAGSKLPSYLLPTFPALALIIAGELAAERPGLRPGAARGVRLSAASLALLAAGIGVALAIYLMVEEPLMRPMAMPLEVILGLGAVGALVSLAAASRRGLLAAVLGLAVAFPATLVLAVVPATEPQLSTRRISATAMAMQPEPGRLLAYRFYDNGFFFYTDATAERHWEVSRLEEIVAERGTSLCFVRSHDLEEIRRSQHLHVEEIDSAGDIHLLRLASRHTD